MKVAGIIQTSGASTLPVYPTLRELSDVVIAATTGEVEKESWFWRCDIKMGLWSAQWDCVGNTMMLMLAAQRAGCGWVIKLDDDMLPSQALLDFLISRKFEQNDVISCRLCDLWGDERQFRTDGVWAKKRFSVVVKNWFGTPAITLPTPEIRYHRTPLPGKPTRHFDLPDDCRLYHYGSLTPELRKARVKKHERLDPNHICQTQGYAYLSDEHGLQTENVPECDAKLLVRASIFLANQPRA